MATIGIEGIKIFAHHGVYAVEKEKGSDFVVDVWLSTPSEKAAASDDLSHTVDYQEVYELVLKIMNKPTQLLERLAEQIARKVLQDHPVVEDVRVRVSKLNPRGMNHCDRTFVEVFYAS